VSEDMCRRGGGEETLLHGHSRGSALIGTDR
jgi:hypothetical protein